MAFRLKWKKGSNNNCRIIDVLAKKVTTIIWPPMYFCFFCQDKVLATQDVHQQFFGATNFFKDKLIKKTIGPRDAKN